MGKDLEFHNLHGVMFDLYGTLVDIDTDEISAEFWSKLADDLSADYSIKKDPDELCARYNQLCARAAVRLSSGRILDQVFQQWLKELDPSGATDLNVSKFAIIFRRRSTRALKMRRYTHELCKQLRNAGIKLAIVSNTEALFTRVDLKDLGLTKYVDTIVLSSDFGMEKPNPEILSRTLELLDISPDSTVFVGDSWNTDVRASLAANMLAIYLTEDTEQNEQDLGLSSRVLQARPTADSIRKALLIADRLLDQA